MSSITHPRLSPIKETVWRPLVRISFDFNPNDYDSVVASCKHWIARTYQKCLGRAIPPQALAAEQNDFQPPGHCFAWLTITNPVDSVQKLFSAKIEHPDLQAARTWSVEFEIAKTEDKVIFGLRTSVFGQDTDNAPQSIPKLAKDLSKRGAMQGGLRLDLSGQEISTVDDLSKLATFVNHPDRVIPLIVITELPDGDGWPADIAFIAEATRGVAVAVAMRNEMTYKWRELMPPKLNVYGGATRIYLPVAKGVLHAPILLDREQREDSDEGVEAWVIRRALQSSTNSPAWINRHANFSTAQRIQATVQRREAIAASRTSRDAEALAAMYEEEIVSLTEQLNIEREESRMWAGEAQEWQDKYNDLEGETRTLRYRLTKQTGENTKPVSQNNAAINFPQTLAEIRDWYENSNIRNHVYIAGRALRECEKSNYDTPADVYKALTILANEYHTSKQPGAHTDSKRQLDLALNEANLHLEFAGGTLTLKNQEYQLDYDQRKLTTDWHLTKGGGRDPRYCMRLYFCWDAETNKCVVGWLPTHLSNSLT